MLPMTQERRKHVRIDVDLKARLFVPKADEVVGPLSASIVNLSEGGAMIRCRDAEVQIGQRLLIEIEFGIDPPTFHTHVSEDSGEVRWVGPQESFGVAFVALTEERRQALHNILKHFGAAPEA